MTAKKRKRPRPRPVPAEAETTAQEEEVAPQRRPFGSGLLAGGP